MVPSWRDVPERERERERLRVVVACSHTIHFVLPVVRVAQSVKSSSSATDIATVTTRTNQYTHKQQHITIYTHNNFARTRQAVPFVGWVEIKFNT